MKFDYLQSDSDLPYIETTAPRRHGAWLILGAVLCVSLVVGVKLYLSRTPATTQAEPTDTSVLSLLPLSLQAAQTDDVPIVTGEIQRDPFQSTERHHAFQKAKEVLPQEATPVSDPAPRSTGLVPLDLKAIVLGGHPKAFINEVFVSEGQSFEIGDAEKVACQVISIDEQVVKVKVGQKIRVLRLASDKVTDKNLWRF